MHPQDIIEATARRHSVSVDVATKTCPMHLRRLINTQRTPMRIAEDYVENLILEWDRAIEAIKREAQHFDDKRLKNLRRRYGPHITLAHLPHGKP